MEKDLEEQLDWVELEDNLESIISNKRSIKDIEKISVDTFTIALYRFNHKKVCNSSAIDIFSDQSAQEPLSSLAPV